MKLTIKEKRNLRRDRFYKIVNKRVIQPYIKKPIGDLDLSSLPIHKLPNNLKYVGGCLDISTSKIESLPNGLIIDGNLWCFHSIIKTLPDDIIINGNMYFLFTKLGMNYTREEFKTKYNVKGELYGFLKDE